VASIGVPAIDGLGPRGEGFHTTSEWVDLSSFVPKAEALARFLCGRLPGL
jgi:glutamate carboxypeptidase